MQSAIFITNYAMRAFDEIRRYSSSRKITLKMEPEIDGFISHQIALQPIIRHCEVTCRGRVFQNFPCSQTHFHKPSISGPRSCVYTIPAPATALIVAAPRDYHFHFAALSLAHNSTDLPGLSSRLDQLGNFHWSRENRCSLPSASSQKLIVIGAIWRSIFLKIR